QDGERASLTAERLTDYVASGAAGTQSAEDAAKQGLNMVLLIQVPLLQPMRARHLWDDELCAMVPMAAAAPQPCRKRSAGSLASDVEEAVIGHGAVCGPYTEIDGLAIARDARFPIRVT